MKLIYQNKGLLIYLSNTAAVKAAKKRGEVIEPLYSIYCESSSGGGVRLVSRGLYAQDVKDLYNQLIDMLRPQINVAKLMNLDG